MTRTISLADDAYLDLAALKAPGESFSQLARRLRKEHARSRLRELAGAWKDLDADAMLADLYRARDESREPRYGTP